jgi:hypothetical protein
MLLILLLALSAIPLLGIVWIIVSGTMTTVDGLFMSLILLAMSGILGMTALFELRQRIFPSGDKKGASAGSRAASAGQTGSIRSGRVQDVVFFESNVGQTNKSVITLNNGGSPQTLVLEGDLRNALPVGRSVKITMRKEGGSNVLVDVSYS